MERRIQAADIADSIHAEEMHYIPRCPSQLYLDGGMDGGRDGLMEVEAL